METENKLKPAVSLMFGEDEPDDSFEKVEVYVTEKDETKIIYFRRVDETSHCNNEMESED